LESHNSFNAIETKNLIADSVEIYLQGRCTLKAIAEQWNTSGGYTALARAVDYFNEVLQKGYREHKPPRAKNLFATGKLPEFSESGKAHFEGILRKYEKFHGKKFIKA
jgi:hypothetical protein